MKKLIILTFLLGGCATNPCLKQNPGNKIAIQACKDRRQKDLSRIGSFRNGRPANFRPLLRF